MFFSILIPVYNTDEYLKECVDSVLMQTDTDYEIVLLNDGSTDNSPKICNKYAEIYPFIRVIHKENEGLLLTRRRGFKEARGLFCVCIDSDDYLCDKYALEKIHSFIDSAKCDLVIYDYIKGGENSKKDQIISLFPYTTNYLFDINGKYEIYEKILTGRDLNFLCCKAISREIIDIETDYLNSKKNVRVGEDFIQTLPVLTVAEKIGYLAEPLYFYRYSPGSIMRSPRMNDYFDYKKMYRAADEYAEIWLMPDNVLNLMKKNRISNIVGHIAESYRLTEEKKKWVDFVENIATDDLISQIYITSKQHDVKLYNRIFLILMKHKYFRLLSVYIRLVDTINKIRR